MLSISILDFVCLLFFVWISLFVFFDHLRILLLCFRTIKTRLFSFSVTTVIDRKNKKKKSEFSVSTFLFLILVSTSFWCCLSDTNSVKVLRKSNSKPILFNELQSDVSHFLYQCVFTFLLFYFFLWFSRFLWLESSELKSKGKKRE